jgi:hypothetical protein
MIVCTLRCYTTETTHNNLAELKCLKLNFRHYMTSAPEAPHSRLKADGPGPGRVPDGLAELRRAGGELLDGLVHEPPGGGGADPEPGRENGERRPAWPASRCTTARPGGAAWSGRANRATEVPVMTASAK